MRAAVIGAQGFAGRCLVNILAERGYAVTGYGRNPPQDDFPGEFTCVDLSREDVFFAEDTQAVFYLAQAGGGDAPSAFPAMLAVNTLGVAKALAACPEGCRVFFHASTGSVYAPSFQPLAEGMPLRKDRRYVLSKVMAEESLDLGRPGVLTVSLRLFALFGKGQRHRLPALIVEAVRKGRPILLHPRVGEGAETGGTHLSFTPVEEACGIMEELGRMALGGASLPARLNLAPSESLSIKEFAERVGSTIGRKPVFAIQEELREQDFIADVGVLGSLPVSSFGDVRAAIGRAYSSLESE